MATKICNICFNEKQDNLFDYDKYVCIDCESNNKGINTYSLNDKKKKCKRCLEYKYLYYFNTSICSECVIEEEKNEYEKNLNSIQAKKEYNKKRYDIRKNQIFKNVNETLICLECQEEKNISDFIKNYFYKNGYSKICKKCSFDKAKTKRAEKEEESGYIYIIINKSFPEYIKLGRAKNVNKRLKSYQTYSPFRDYELYYHIFTSKLLLIENYFNKNIERANGEWFKIDKEIAKNIIEKLL